MSGVPPRQHMTWKVKAVKSRTGVRQAAATTALAVILAGCSAPESPTETDRPASASQRGLPSAHVHAVAVDPSDGTVLLATHDGLFRVSGEDDERVGPVVDLMGFTVAGPGHYYASGHPGEGSDLPDPVGLIESKDAGQTWQSLSRAGESDFHTLTASNTQITGYDGVLRITTDGMTWSEQQGPDDLFDVAASPDGAALLATTPTGPWRSSDGGASWLPIEGAPLLMLVEWSDPSTAFGVTPEGQIEYSEDAGQTWQSAGVVDDAPQAMGVRTSAGSEAERVLVVGADTLWESSDGGQSFAPFTEGP